MTVKEIIQNAINEKIEQLEYVTMEIDEKEQVNIWYKDNLNNKYHLIQKNIGYWVLTVNQTKKYDIKNI